MTIYMRGIEIRENVIKNYLGNIGDKQWIRNTSDIMKIYF